MDLLQSSSEVSESPAEIATQEFAGDSAASRLRLVTKEDDDGALMLRYRSGDVRAFETLYSRHKGALYRYLQRLCRQRDTVNDLFQEVWSRVISSRERYEARAQFTTFLFHIAHNCAMDHFRRTERRHTNKTDDVAELQDYLSGAESDRPEAQVSAGQLQAAFERALRDLPPDQRNVFVLREETGMTLEEIGSVTGVSMETAKSRLRYALVKLRETLKQYEPKQP